MQCTASGSYSLEKLSRSENDDLERATPTSHRGMSNAKPATGNRSPCGVDAAATLPSYRAQVFTTVDFSEGGGVSRYIVTQDDVLCWTGRQRTISDQKLGRPLAIDIGGVQTHVYIVLVLSLVLIRVPSEDV